MNDLGMRGARVAVDEVTWLLCSNAVGSHMRAAISSCLDQSVGAAEVVLVANGPRHADVEDVVNSWYPPGSGVRVLSTPMSGLPNALNLGLCCISTPLVARLDTDDFAYRERLEIQLQYMRDNPTVDVLGGGYDVVDLDGRVLSAVRNPIGHFAIRNWMYFRNAICHPSVLFRRSVVIDRGGYLGSLHAEDYDLWCRLLVDGGVRFANVPDRIIGYRRVGESGARGSRLAYSAMAAAQFRSFALSVNPLWFISAGLSLAKARVIGVAR